MRANPDFTCQDSAVHRLREENFHEVKTCLQVCMTKSAHLRDIAVYRGAAGHVTLVVPRDLCGHPAVQQVGPRAGEVRNVVNNLLNLCVLRLQGGVCNRNG